MNILRAQVPSALFVYLDEQDPVEQDTELVVLLYVQARQFDGQATNRQATHST